VGSGKHKKKKRRKKGKAMKWAYLSIEKGSSRTAQHHANSSNKKGLEPGPKSFRKCLPKST